jgi:uncharacterized protein
MNSPLTLSLGLGHGFEMLIAVVVGAGVGFVFERAGFGRADHLVSIFYGRDFRVLRVLLSAIVTAMLGLYLADLTGLLPLPTIGLLDTYVLPQLVGGLLLGAGFIIGGYCPGSSLVASVSGKLDAMLFIGGLFLGSFVFTASYEGLASFHNGTALGRVLLHEFLGVPAALLVPGVVLMAIGAFWGAGKVEAAIKASRKSS